MARNRDKKKNKGSLGHHTKSGNDFLEKNANKPDITVTESGLQYTIINEGDGEYPQPTDNVIVNQRALLLNGKVIDDTYKTGEPQEFRLKDVIEGYQEGLLMMKVGSRYKFFIPPELGWGKKGSSSKIPPNAVIIFDVSLLEVVY